jgi:predicted metal-dependent phosphoesterase TrpH
MPLPEFVKSEFHCHTIYSKDSQVTIRAIISTCQQKGIQRLVITDHNNIQGAIIAHELDPVRFIIGEEINTQQGELLGIFIKEQIPSGLPASKTLELLHSQAAFISVSHPFDTFRQGHWDIDDLLNIVPGIDAIEIFNSRCLNPHFNTLAGEFAQRYRLLGTVGSDAHSTGEIGTATLTLPEFNDTSTLRSALSFAQPHVHLSSPFVHFHSRFAKWHKLVDSNIFNLLLNLL